MVPNSSSNLLLTFPRMLLRGKCKNMSFVLKIKMSPFGLFMTLYVGCTKKVLLNDYELKGNPLICFYI